MLFSTVCTFYLNFTINFRAYWPFTTNATNFVVVVVVVDLFLGFFVVIPINFHSYLNIVDEWLCNFKPIIGANISCLEYQSYAMIPDWVSVL